MHERGWWWWWKIFGDCEATFLVCVENFQFSFDVKKFILATAERRFFFRSILKTSAWINFSSSRMCSSDFFFSLIHSLSSHRSLSNRLHRLAQEAQLFRSIGTKKFHTRKKKIFIRSSLLCRSNWNLYNYFMFLDRVKRFEVESILVSRWPKRTESDGKKRVEKQRKKRPLKCASELADKFLISSMLTPALSSQQHKPSSLVHFLVGILFFSHFLLLFRSKPHLTKLRWTTTRASRTVETELKVIAKEFSF